MAPEKDFSSDIQTLVAPYQKGVMVVYPEITTAEEMVSATEKGKRAKAMMAEVEKGYDDLIADAHNLHKKMIERKKQYWSPFKSLYDSISRRITEYRDREEKKRQEAERLLQEQAQKEAQDRLMHESAQLERTGNIEEAHMVMEEALSTPAPVIVAPSTLPKVEGVFGRKGAWKFRIKDQSKIKPEYFCPDLDAIGAIVKTKGQLAHKLVGDGALEIYQENTTVIRG
jgi:hypothetical protein